MNMSDTNNPQKVDDLIRIIQKQQQQIDKLEKQVSECLNRDKKDDDKKEKKSTTDKEEVDSNLGDRVKDLEDVVTNIKGDVLELMMVYQEIQDKLFDIDRCKTCLRISLRIFNI